MSRCSKLIRSTGCVVSRSRPVCCATLTEVGDEAICFGVDVADYRFRNAARKMGIAQLFEKARW